MSIKYDVIETADGSHTLQISGTNITFHSTKGAVQESDHIFIKCGLEHFVNKNPSNKSISILEVGFGTGLNALLTASFAARYERMVIYNTIELNPLPEEVYANLNYPRLLNQPELYKAIMSAEWNQTHAIDSFFSLNKIHDDILEHDFKQRADLIYFDAFAPGDQAEMWSDLICEKMFGLSNSGGILVTYCSKSIVRKAFARAGFTVEKLAGPPGKREIIRAVKP